MTPITDATLSSPEKEAFRHAFRQAFHTVSELVSFLGRAIIRIDARLSSQLSEIMEASRFAALEGSWRGVESLVSQLSGGDLKLKLLDQNWDELAQDLQESVNERYSVIYRKIGMAELDTLGGEPFGIVLIDHALSMSVDSDVDDFFIAQLIASLGEQCLCPVIMSVSTDFFERDDPSWMTNIARLKRILSGAKYDDWRNLRNLPQARFLGLVWPEIRLRGRYEDQDIGFRFHQWPSQSDGLWSNGGYAFLRTVMKEFYRCAWFGFLKLVGEEPGKGAVLAQVPGKNEQGRVRLTRGIGQTLSELGLIPLCESTHSDALYFSGNRSVTDCHEDPALEVLTQIQSIMIVCRIAHYVKIQTRALIGQTQTASECELTLNNWIENYCSPLSEASSSMLASYPLRKAKIKVRENAAGPSRFKCAVTIQPQYQVDYMEGDVYVSTDILSGRK